MRRLRFSRKIPVWGRLTCTHASALAPRWTLGNLNFAPTSETSRDIHVSLGSNTLATGELGREAWTSAFARRRSIGYQFNVF